MGKKGVVLKADSRIPEVWGKVVDPLTVEEDVPRADIGEAADQSQKSRLAAAAGSDKRNQLSSSDLKLYTFEHLVVSIKFVDILQNQHRIFVFFAVHIPSDPFRCHTAADFFMLLPSLVLLLMKFRISIQIMTIRTSFIVVAEAMPISP